MNRRFYRFVNLDSKKSYSIAVFQEPNGRAQTMMMISVYYKFLLQCTPFLCRVSFPGSHSDSWWSRLMKMVLAPILIEFNSTDFLVCSTIKQCQVLLSGLSANFFFHSPAVIVNHLCWRTLKPFLRGTQVQKVFFERQREWAVSRLILRYC